jgi:hypothetical protein
MLDVYEFKTGRNYDRPQTLRWRINGDVTEFLDASRGIWGTIATVCIVGLDVLHHYDAGNYRQGGYSIYQELRTAVVKGNK